jgi:hypothetical protein
MDKRRKGFSYIFKQGPASLPLPGNWEAVGAAVHLTYVLFFDAVCHN